MKLENKVAIVTGAGGGIGRAIAERFVDEGAQVVIAEIDGDSGADAARALGNRAVFVEADLGDVASIDALVARTVADHGGLDILVNNAGVTRKLDFFEVTPEDWDWMHGVNSRGVFFCMQRAAQEMRKAGRGKVINIASIAGKGYRGTSNIAYAASKGAVIAMTRIGRPTRQAQHQRERDLPWRHLDAPGGEGHDREWQRHPAAGGTDHPARPCQPAGRHGQHGRLPGVGRVRQHHRPVVQCRRRSDVGLSCGTRVRRARS